MEEVHKTVEAKV